MLNFKRHKINPGKLFISAYIYLIIIIAPLCGETFFRPSFVLMVV